jgi:AraC-like DNA-binding protein
MKSSIPKTRVTPASESCAWKALGHVRTVESVGMFQSPPVWTLTPAIIGPQREYIELITAGVVYDAECGPERECGPGTLFWHVAGERTIHRTLPEAPYRCLCVCFSVTTPNRRVPRRTLAGDAEWACTLAEELMAAFHNPVKARTMLAVYAYSRLLWAGMAAPPDNEQNLLPHALQNLRNSLESKPELLKAGVDELAAAAGISAPHLHLLCRQHWHTSPHQLVLVRRVALAKRLLAGGHLPVKAVASECGFDNTESFCRAFRRLTGASPGTYRMKHTRPG